MFLVVEDGVVEITLCKKPSQVKEGNIWWPCVVKGDPEISVRSISFSYIGQSILGLKLKDCLQLSRGSFIGLEFKLYLKMDSLLTCLLWQVKDIEGAKYLDDSILVKIWEQKQKEKKAKAAAAAAAAAQASGEAPASETPASETSAAEEVKAQELWHHHRSWCEIFVLSLRFHIANISILVMIPSSTLLANNTGEEGKNLSWSLASILEELMKSSRYLI